MGVGVRVILIVTAATAAALLSRRAPIAGELVFDTPNPSLADLDPGPTTQPVYVTLAASFAEAARDIADRARKLFALPASAAPYAETIRAAEQTYGIPDSLLGRLLYQESRFRSDVITGQVKSSAGALGIAHFMPATAPDVGIDPLDPPQAIPGAAKYLRQLYDATGSWDKALASYNWGIGNVQRRGLAAAPAETRAYVSDILGDVDV